MGDPRALALATARLDGLIDSCNRALAGHNGQAPQMRPPRARGRKMTDSERIRLYCETGQWKTHKAVRP